MLLPRRQWIIKIDFSVKKQVGGGAVCSVYVFMKRRQIGCRNTGQYFMFLWKSSFLYFQLHVLENWSSRNGKKFISTKCVIIHLGSNNLNICFNLKSSLVGNVWGRKWPYCISWSQNDYKQYDVAVRRACVILRYVRRGISRNIGHILQEVW